MKNISFEMLHAKPQRLDVVFLEAYFYLHRKLACNQLSFIRASSNGYHERSASHVKVQLERSQNLFL